MNVSQTLCTCGKLVHLAPGACIFCGRELGDRVLVCVVDPEEAVRGGAEHQRVQLRGRDTIYNTVYNAPLYNSTPITLRGRGTKTHPMNIPSWAIDLDLVPVKVYRQIK